MLKQEGQSIYLRLASNDAVKKVSNSQFTVDLATWPNELGRGVTGVSLVSASFPQNVANVTERNNQFRWHSETVPFGITIPNEAFSYTITRRSTGGSYFVNATYTGGSFTDATTLAASLQVDYRAAYVAFMTLVGGTGVGTDVSVTSSDGYHLTISNDPAADYRIEIYASQINLDLGFSARDITEFHRDTAPDSITTTTMPFTHLETLPAGWYDSSSLAAAVVAAMSASTGGATYTMAEDPFTEQWVITPVTNPGDVIKFLPRTQGTTAATLLGMGDDAVHGPVVTLPYKGNLHGPGMLYIHSSKLTGHNSFDGDGAVISIAKAIPITAEYRMVQTFVNNDAGVPDHLMPRRKVFRQINITLRDGDGHAVDIGAGILRVKFRLYY